MKSRIYLSSLLFVILVLLVYSCKKYPDGPLLNFQSKEKRVIGIWDVKYFGINGYDSTSYLKSKPFYGMYNLDKRDGDNEPYARYAATQTQYIESGNWWLEDKKNNLHIAFATTLYPASTVGPYRALDVIWEI